MKGRRKMRGKSQGGIEARHCMAHWEGEVVEREEPKR